MNWEHVDSDVQSRQHQDVLDTSGQPIKSLDTWQVTELNQLNLPEPDRSQAACTSDKAGSRTQTPLVPRTLVKLPIDFLGTVSCADREVLAPRCEFCHHHKHPGTSCRKGGTVPRILGHKNDASFPLVPFPRGGDSVCSRIRPDGSEEARQEGATSALLRW